MCQCKSFNLKDHYLNENPDILVMLLCSLIHHSETICMAFFEIYIILFVFFEEAHSFISWREKEHKKLCFLSTFFLLSLTFLNFFSLFESKRETNNDQRWKEKQLFHFVSITQKEMFFTTDNLYSMRIQTIYMEREQSERKRERESSGGHDTL